MVVVVEAPDSLAFCSVVLVVPLVAEVLVSVELVFASLLAGAAGVAACVPSPPSPPGNEVVSVTTSVTGCVVVEEGVPTLDVVVVVASLLAVEVLVAVRRRASFATSSPVAPASPAFPGFPAFVVDAPRFRA